MMILSLSMLDDYNILINICDIRRRVGADN